MTGTQAYWEKIYSTRGHTEVSWFSPHLQTSLDLMQRVATKPCSSIIDVGGGESTLVDDVVALGYQNVTVMDISQVAIEHTKERLGPASNAITWLVANILQADLPTRQYDVWQDRAAFHFLTEPAQRLAYVRQVASSVKRGGHVIVGTFGPEGPTECSGLDAIRYDAESLHDEFGPSFRLVESSKELHTTPFGNVQQFLYCYCVVE